MKKPLLVICIIAVLAFAAGTDTSFHAKEFFMRLHGR